MDVKKTLLICFGILIAGAAVTLLIFSTEPEASRSGATRETAMLVQVTDTEQGAFKPVVEVMGTVQPSQDINLSPRVSGEIISRNDAFTPGGYVQKGQTLLQIDPADYQTALQQRKSELNQALSDLDIEMGRQDVARQDFEVLGDTLAERLSKQNKSLVLREPQLNAAKSSVQSARAAVQQAELNLQRTTIRAPFNAHILSRNVNVGSQVTSSDNLGRLVGQDTYWVEATVMLSKLRRLSFPENGEQGAEVRIRNNSAWDPGEYRTGYLYRLVGSLENNTRLARILIEVPDPRALQPENSEAPAMIIGSFVEANIMAEELPDVIRLNRDYIRDNDVVWVKEDSLLRIQKVNIVFRDPQYAYIDSGLSARDQIVTSNLATVTDGAPLRLEGEGAEGTAAKQDSLNMEEEN
jgi:RND family efflux transporter MFP subunit